MEMKNVSRITEDFSKENITVVASISADRQLLPPLVIFQENIVKKCERHTILEQIALSLSNGWMPTVIASSLLGQWKFKYKLYIVSLAVL